MIVDGLKTASMFVGGVLIVGTLVAVFGLATVIYISFGENSWEVLKALI